MLRTLISPWVTASSASSASFTSSPSSATNGSGSGTYTYDGNGQRVEKVSGGTTIVTIFAGSQVLAEYYNNAQPSSPTNEYIYAGSMRVASIQSGTTDYWHNDHLSPRVRTDTSGNVADQRGTFPFGETWYSPGSSPYMFTSYYRDYEAAGNDYAQARTYVGGLGRFSSPDPVSGSTSDPQSLNRYSYVRNMPVMLTDPFGLTPSCNTAKNPDTSQPQDSKSGGGPSAPGLGGEADPDPQGNTDCEQTPWYDTIGGGGMDPFFGDDPGDDPLAPSILVGGGSSSGGGGLNFFLGGGGGSGLGPDLFSFLMGGPYGPCSTFYNDGTGNVVTMGSCGGGNSSGGAANNGKPTCFPRSSLNWSQKAQLVAAQFYANLTGWTFGFGAGADAGAGIGPKGSSWNFGAGGSASTMIVADGAGNSGFFNSASGGFSAVKMSGAGSWWGAGAAAGPSFLVSPYPISKIAGPSGSVSGGGGAVLGAGASITTSGAATFTFGVGAGAEAGFSPQFGTSQFIPVCHN